MRPLKVTKEDLVEKIKVWAEINGKTPSLFAFCNDPNNPCVSFISRKYGWNNLIKEAGLETNNTSFDRYDRKGMVKDYKSGMKTGDIIKKHRLKNKDHLNQILIKMKVKRNRYPNVAGFCKCGKPKAKGWQCKECQREYQTQRRRKKGIKPQEERQTLAEIMANSSLGFIESPVNVRPKRPADYYTYWSNLY